MPRTYSLSDEPCEAAYYGLLDFALTNCSSMLLVVRPRLGLEPSACKAINELACYLIAEEEKSAWPGTRLLAHTAIVRTYQYRAEVTERMKAFSVRLFDWQQPRLPEDLCLLRNNGTPWLVTIAHERDAYLEISEDERNGLLAFVPSLPQLIPEEGNSQA